MAFGVGSSVGYVYVEVLADTSSMREQILRDAKKDGSDGGEVFGNNFARSLEDSAQKVQFDKIYKKSINNLSKDIALQIRDAEKRGLTEIEFSIRPEWADELKRIATQYGITFEELQERLQTDLTGAIRRASDEIEREEAKNLKTRLDNIKKAEEAAEKALKDEARERARLERLSYEEYAKYLTKKERDRQAAAKAAENAEIAADRRRQARAQRYFKQNADFFAGSDFQDSISKLGDRIRKNVSLNTRKGFVEGTRDADFGPDLNTKLSFIAYRFGTNIETVLRNLRPELRIQVREDEAELLREGSLGRVAQSFGRINNAIRRQRSGIIRGLLTPLRLATGAATGFINVIFSGAQSFQKLSGFFSDLALQGGRLAGVFGQLAQLSGGFGRALSVLARNPITAVIAAVVALVAGIAVLGTVLAGISIVVQTLAAGVLLLVNTLIGLVGALGVLVPVFAAVGAAAGAAILGLSDYVGAVKLAAKASSGAKEDVEAYQKALKKLGPNTREAVKATEDLIPIFQGVKKELSERIFKGLSDDIKGLKGPLTNLKDNFVGFGDVVNRVLGDFIKKVSEPKSTKLFDNLSESLQRISGDLGGAFNNFLFGVLDFIEVISPLAERFAKSLLEISENFTKFLETPEGRKEIFTFFERAYEIATTVKDIFVELLGLFLDLFGITNDETTNGLQLILDKIEEWRTWVQNNEKTINQWLKRAGEFASDVWAALSDVIGALKKIDPSLVAATIGILLAALEGVLLTVGTIYNGFVSWVKYVAAIPNKIRGPINEIIALINRIPGINIPALGTGGASKTKNRLPTAPGNNIPVRLPDQRRVTINQYNSFPQTNPEAAAASVLNRIVTANI